MSALKMSYPAIVIISLTTTQAAPFLPFHLTQPFMLAAAPVILSLRCYLISGLSMSVRSKALHGVGVA